MRIEEANLSQSMKYVFNTFIKDRGLDPDNILDYRPYNQKETEWLRDNPTTGVIFLKKHPNAREAWILVKFERKEAEYGIQKVPQQRKTIKTKEEFEEFFGVAPAKNFYDDMIIQCSWDKQDMRNKNAKRDFDETAPNFFRYGNHLKVSLTKAIKGMYRINELIEEVGPVGDLFQLPYSDTNF